MVLEVFEAGPPEAQTLLFLHGWCCTHDMMQPLVERLGEDYRCLNVDLLGHGQSPKAANYAIETQCDALESTFAGILQDMTIIGHSMGGQIALELAARGSAKAAVLLDPAHITPHAGALAWGEKMREDLEDADIPEHMDAFARGQFHYPIDRLIVEGLAATMEAMDTDVVVEAWDAILSYNAAPALARLDVPVLTIFADTPLNDGRAMAKASNHIRLAQTACSGHMQQYDAPDQLNTMIRRFLQVCG